jgi:hypothetical protein
VEEERLATEIAPSSNGNAPPTVPNSVGRSKNSLTNSWPAWTFQFPVAWPRDDAGTLSRQPTDLFRHLSRPYVVSKAGVDPGIAHSATMVLKSQLPASKPTWTGHQVGRLTLGEMRSLRIPARQRREVLTCSLDQRHRERDQFFGSGRSRPRTKRSV